MDKGTEKIIIGAAIAIGIMWFATGGTLGVGEAIGLGTAGGPTNEGSDICPDTGKTDVFVSTTNKLADPDIAVTGNYSIYLDGSTRTITSGNHAAAGTTITGPVSCLNRDAYRVVFGDGFTNYHLSSDLTTASGSIQRFNDVPYLTVGSATMVFSNGTAFDQATVKLKLGSGESSNAVTMKLSEGTNDGYFGVPDQLYTFVGCFDYDVGNFSKVSISGGTPLGVFAQAAGYERCEGYKVPGNLADWDKAEVTIIIETISGVNPQRDALNSTNITIKVFDWATYMHDGMIMYGAENADTATAIGATDITTAQTIAVY